jgi:hypothetical protein
MVEPSRVGVEDEWFCRFVHSLFLSIGASRSCYVIARPNLTTNREANQVALIYSGFSIQRLSAT